MGPQRKLLLLAAAVVGMITPSAASAAPPSPAPNPTQLLTGLEGGSGSTVGPGGALYVTESAAGRISRVDPRTGVITTFASGLPKSIVGIGGTTDVADIGAFALSNPPSTPFDIPTGVQYALETYRGGFLVTDGHHNRVLRVTRDGDVTEMIAFDNIVPTGLAVWGNTVYMAEAGPVPHEPEDGKVVSFRPKSPTATEVASGASLLVDVEFGRGGDLFALSQGVFGGGPPGSPAQPNTGSLVKVNGNGTFTVVTDGLDRPTSVEFIRNTAYVVTLTGEIWKVDSVSGPPCG